MVSKTKKFIYIHINKCAGTSMREFLRPDLFEEFPSLVWPKDHATLQEIYEYNRATLLIQMYNKKNLIIKFTINT